MNAPPFASESQRYEYDLNRDSIVIDAGCYEGAWSEEISRRYGSRIFAFEPVARFFLRCEQRLKPYAPHVIVIPAALGATSRIDKIHVQNDSTGFYAGSADVEDVNVYAITNIWPAFGIHFCDLLKLNIEGAEYEVLESLIAHDQATRCANIQVQFHRIGPDYEARYAAIRRGLEKTHEMTWGTDYLWENWRIK